MSDVDEMLEAAYSDEGQNSDQGKADRDSHSPTPERKSKKRKKHSRRRSRSRSKSRSDSEERKTSKSRERRRMKRSRSRSPYRKRSRSRSPRRRKSRSRSPYKKRSRSRSPVKKRSRSPFRKRSRSRSPVKRRSRSRSPPRRPSQSYSPYRKRSRSRSPYRKWHGPRNFRGYQGRKDRSPSPEHKPPSPGLPKSPTEDIPDEDRDRRTVFCMQLSQRVGVKELEEFISQAGKVKHVKLIADKNSRRSKGIAYVEFMEAGSVQLAMGMSGQKLFGVPIMLQPTMAEKNRAAQNAENLKKPDGPRKLYVGNLHPNINEIMLKAVFEPFGMLDQVKVQREANGNSKGYGFVEFKSPEVADNAMKHLNGFELANQPIRVNYVNERTADMESLDTQDIDVGVGMTATSRASLMAKLSEGHKAGLTVPGLPQQSGPSSMSSCLVLQNMFDPAIESGAAWKEDVRDDVLSEVNKFGAVFHIHVDATSPQGCVYVKCQAPQVATAAVSTLQGRKYGGKEIKAQCMPETQYHGIFPMAMSAMIPLRPSS